MDTKRSMLGSEVVRLIAGVLLAGAALAVTAGPAAAQKPPWEITEVKSSEKALTGRVVSGLAEETSEFVGNEARKVFLYVTVKFEKAPTANTLRAVQVLNKKKKAVGQLFNVVVDKDDRKTVTVIFRNTNPWESVEDLQLRASSHTAPLKKKDDPPKK